MRLTDNLSTDELSAGLYTYHFDWKPTVAAASRSSDLSFEIVKPAVKAEAEAKTP